jgi:hypothetical protein
MRATRLLYLLALIAILTLSACGSVLSPSSAKGIEQAARIDPPEIPEIRSAKSLANLIPNRLVIPAVGINGFVEPLGIRSNGDLATPAQNPWTDVGWYDLGPHPGERGSAVIDGHLDRPGGYPAVFWRLRDVQVGEDVQVVDDGGKTLHFRVTRVAYYPPDQAPLQDIFGNQSGTYLNLITCAGDWIPSEHQTTLRLVVYTTFV